jgi:hypothetical protein
MKGACAIRPRTNKLGAAGENSKKKGMAPLVRTLWACTHLQADPRLTATGHERSHWALATAQEQAFASYARITNVALAERG